MTSQLVELGGRVEGPTPPPERERLEWRARLLSRLGIGWHLIEFGIAIGAGIVAGSVALIGFGFDSLIESAAALVILWLFTGGRGASQAAERRAQQLIASSYFLLVVYIAVAASRDLIAGQHPSASWIGVGLAAFTAPTMPLLARAKRRVGRQFGSRATASEAEQTQICAYLSIARLAGLLLNATLGWWWADPVAALAIGAVALNEAVQSWRGESCSDDCC
ncbi:MAG: cation transporter [Acidobacteriota bacterium]|nr:cation transporter [Acidobacteriota bacterium]